MPTFMNSQKNSNKQTSAVDGTDIKILNALQANARISNAELAELVNLSQTPCLRRLRKLEHMGSYSAMHNESRPQLAWH